MEPSVPTAKRTCPPGKHRSPPGLGRKALVRRQGLGGLCRTIRSRAPVRAPGAKRKRGSDKDLLSLVSKVSMTHPRLRFEPGVTGGASDELFCPLRDAFLARQSGGGHAAAPRQRTRGIAMNAISSLSNACYWNRNLWIFFRNAVEQRRNVSPLPQGPVSSGNVQVSEPAAEPARACGRDPSGEGHVDFQA